MLVDTMSNDEAQVLVSSMVLVDRVDLGGTTMHFGYHPDRGNIMVVIDALGDAAVVKERVTTLATV